MGLVRTGTGRGGASTDMPGHGCLACHGAELTRPWYLAQLAEAYWQEGQGQEGLTVLKEALTLVNTTEERWWEAELHRLQGELLLAMLSRAYCGGRSLLSARPRHRSLPAGKVPRTASGNEPESALAAAG